VNYWQALLLGLVQGLTEFLPVSSDGHLVLAEHLAGVHTPGVFVEVALHVATLGSILVMYGRRFFALAAGVLARRPADVQYAGLLILAMIPAGIVGLFLEDLIARAFDSGFS
jgi:undecaprenyl-diphosphatase